MRLFQRKRVVMACLAVLGIAVTGCISNDISQPVDPNTGGDVKNKSEYFDFSTRQDVQVHVDYKTSTSPVDVAVYTSDPYNEVGELDESIKPIFSAFTEEGVFDAQITVPSYATRLYISAVSAGYPLLLNELTTDGQIISGLPIKNGQVNWTAPTVAELNAILPLANATTRAFFENHLNVGNSKLTLDEGGLYSLYDTYYHTYSTTAYMTINSQVNGLYAYLTDDSRITGNNTVGDLVNRLNATLYDHGRKKDNSAYLRGADDVNLTVMNKTTDGQDVDHAQVDLVFLGAAGSYHNAMAYYYYPAGQSMTAAQLHALPKFVVFPRTTKGLPSVKLTARLQFFGANYDEPGIDSFPPGYTIGWMLIPNVNFGTADELSEINGQLANTYQSKYIYSNTEANVNGNSRTPYNGTPLPGCISLYDSRTQTYVIGFEDQSYKGDWGDSSFEDILFFAVCNPADAFTSEAVPLKDEIVQPIWKTTTEEGTLAFEDLWPEEGDYDLNDMIVEYKSTVTYNQWNEVKEIVDEYKPVYDGAVYKNAFAVIYNEAMGNVDKTNSTYAVQEAANRFVLWTNNQDALDKNQTFTIRRTWEEGSYLDKGSRQRNVNPFLIINYTPGDHNRSEVHLPMTSPSPWANTSLNNTASDAYYVNRDGGYPFAIELYGVTDWKANKVERRRIDDSAAFPLFKSWAQSKGVDNKDWYNK